MPAARPVDAALKARLLGALRAVLSESGLIREREHWEGFEEVLAGVLPAVRIVRVDLPGSARSATLEKRSRILDAVEEVPAYDFSGDGGPDYSRVDAMPYQFGRTRRQLFEEVDAPNLKPLANIFLRMIKSLIVPLLFSTLVIGIAGHGDDMKKVGRLALRSIIYFEIVTTLALAVGPPAAALHCPTAWPHAWRRAP